MLYYKSGQSVYSHPTQSIEVRENEAYRWLHFGDPHLQSVMSLTDLDTPALSYLNLMLKVLDFKPNPKRILILGLGGGAIVRYLLKNYPTASIDVIEINPVVIEIAHRYFSIPTNFQQLNIMLGDAAESMTKLEQKYDIIFHDIYEKNCMPSCMLHATLYADYRKQLNAQGSVALNIVCPSFSELVEIIQFIQGEFGQNTIIVPSKDSYNIVVFAFNGTDFKKQVNLWMDAGRLVKAKFDAELGLVVEFKEMK